MIEATVRGHVRVRAILGMFARGAPQCCSLKQEFIMRHNVSTFMARSLPENILEAVVANQSHAAVVAQAASEEGRRREIAALSRTGRTSCFRVPGAETARPSDFLEFTLGLADRSGVTLDAERVKSRFRELLSAKLGKPHGATLFLPKGLMTEWSNRL